MAVAPVQFLPGTTTNANTATVTATVGVTTPEGAALLVIAGTSGIHGATGVTDTAGNTYTLVAQSTVNESVACFAATASFALSAGVSTVTVTFSGATTEQKNAFAVYVQGAILVDLAATNNGASATASVTGGTPAFYNELCLAIIQGANGTTPLASPAGYAFYAGVFPPGQETTALYYQYLPSPTAQNLSSALGGSGQWAMLFVSLYTTPLTLPSVPNFVAGYGPQQSDMQSLWVNPLAVFQNRVVFRAVQATTATTLPSSGAVTTIAYDDVLEDPYGGWNPSTHQWTPPAGCSGVYQVSVTVYVVAPAALQVVLSPYVGGSAAYNQNSGVRLSGIVIPQQVAGAESTEMLYLTGGQDAVWGAAVIANSASNVNTSLAAGTQSSMEIIWIGQ